MFLCCHLVLFYFLLFVLVSDVGRHVFLRVAQLSMHFVSAILADVVHMIVVRGYDAASRLVTSFVPFHACLVDFPSHRGVGATVLPRAFELCRVMSLHLVFNV